MKTKQKSQQLVIEITRLLMENSNTNFMLLWHLQNKFLMARSLKIGEETKKLLNCKTLLFKINW